MIIHHDPDRFKTVSEHHVCDYHKKHPGKPYAGCCCSSSYSNIRVSDEEYQERRKKRLGERREELKEELAAIETEIGE